MNINKFTQSSMAAVQNLEKIAADYRIQKMFLFNFLVAVFVSNLFCILCLQ